MTSSELGSSRALFAWLQAAAVASVGTSGCSWASASDFAAIEVAPPAVARQGDGELSSQQCAALCPSRESSFAGEWSHPYVSRCYVVELRLPFASAAGAAPQSGVSGTSSGEAGAGTSGARARGGSGGAGLVGPPPTHGVVCRYHEPGSLQVDVFPLTTPYGRVAPAQSDDFAMRDVESEAQYFATVARAEAASVASFHELARALEELQAPAALPAAAKRAARDEARHARHALTLAHRYGGSRGARVKPLVRPERRRLGLYELALENALSGCVGESFGVWLHLVQARAALDAQVRAFAKQVAREEARHAALAFRLHDWLTARLGAEERRAVTNALHAAWRRAPESLAAPARLAERLGLPSAAQALSFVQLGAQLARA